MNVGVISEGEIYMLKVLFYFEFKNTYFTMNSVKLLQVAAFWDKFWLRWYIVFLLYSAVIGT